MSAVKNLIYHTFQAPYREAGFHFLKAQEATAWGRKISHYSLAALYAIPVVGAIVLLAVRFFSTPSAAASHNMLDRLNYPGNSKNAIDKLVDENKIEEAWQLFKDTKKRNPYIIPSEKLITAVVKEWASADIIQRKVSVECVRDCAIAYESFRKLCLKEPKLWGCFHSYPESIADIAKESSAFAFEVITSAKGDLIRGDEYRMELYNSAYPELLKRMQEGKISLQEMRNFGFFMFRFELVAKQEDMESLNKLASVLEKHKSLDPQCRTIFDLIIGKLAIQRSHIPSDLSNYDHWQEFVEFFTLDRHNFDECEIGRRLIALNCDENIRKGIIYLYCFPESYSQHARLALGNFWLDQEEYNEAGDHYLQAAILQYSAKELKPAELSIRQDALMLAASALVVKTKDGYALRGDQKNDTAERKLLKVDECRALVANKTEFSKLILNFNNFNVKAFAE